MRITRIKLVNFIGIHDALHKNEIEIKIPDNGNIFTEIVADNGGGKSTILSQLHPFLDSYDERESVIMEGCDGIKEIDFEHNGSVYNVVHFVSADRKTKTCTIMKDGNELNGAGKVRKFEEIVEKELGCPKDYPMLGKLGAGASGFVELNATARKEFISDKVSGSEKYIEKYKLVSEKFSAQKQTLALITKDLGRYDDESIIAARLLSNKEQLKSTEKSIEELTGKIAVNKSELDRIDKKYSGIDYEKLVERQNDLTKSKFAVSNIITGIEIRYPKDSEFYTSRDKIEDLRKEYVKSEADLSKDNNTLENAKNKAIELQNEVLKINYRLKGVEVGDLNVIEDELKELNTRKEQYENTLKESIFTKKGYIRASDMASLSSSIAKYDSFMVFVDKYYRTLNEKIIDKDVANVKLFFKESFPEAFKRHLATTKTALENAKKLKSDKDVEFGQKMSNVSKLDILAQRPTDCINDSCPFIRDALQYKNLPKEIDDLNAELDRLQRTITDFDYENDRLADLKLVYKNIALSYKELNPMGNPFFKCLIGENGDFAELVSTMPQQEFNKMATLISEAGKEFIAAFDGFISTNSAIETKTKTKEVITNSNQYAESYRKEIDEKTALLEQNSIEIETLSKHVSAMRTDTANKLKYLNDLDNYFKAIDDYAEIDKQLDETINKVESIDAIFAEKSKISDELKNLNTDLINANNLKTSLNDSIRKDEIALDNIQRLKNQFNEVSKTYGMLNLLRDALDPKSGIPLVFIQSYLGRTEIIANELLNLAFKGKLEIKFESSAKEFFIRVRTEDTVKPDIKAASSGERALATISISLALIEQASGAFNILCLDEMDSNLDADNRESFISIIEAQIKRLGIEQVFVISHSNKFDNINMNLIALKNAKKYTSNEVFMKNKTLIYEHNED